MNDLTIIAQQIDLCRKDFFYFVEKYCPYDPCNIDLQGLNVLLSCTDAHKQILYRYIVHQLLFSTNLKLYFICDDTRDQTTSRLEILKIISQLPQYFKQFVTCNNSTTLQIGTNNALWVASNCVPESTAIIINTIDPNFIYKNSEKLQLTNCQHIICMGNYNNSLSHNFFKYFKILV